jgi:hypothetical protein
MVPKTNAVPLGGRRKKIERLVEQLPEGAFSEVSTARDTGVGRPWEWVCLELAPVPEKTMRRWLLIRRSIEDPEDLGFYQAYGPEGTTVKELVGTCQERWAVEECFAEAKGEVGLDHYEVRRWDAWHRHVTLSLLAHAFLAVTRRAAAKEEGSPTKKGISTPISSRPERAGGEEAHPRHVRAEEPKTLPVEVVDVEADAPIGCGPQPQDEPGSQTRGETRARKKRDAPDRRHRARRSEPHR